MGTPQVLFSLQFFAILWAWDLTSTLNKAFFRYVIEGKHEYRTVKLNEKIALKIGPDEELV